jgi:hypothetical protein
MHRRTSRVENFGGRFAAAILDLLAIGPFSVSVFQPARVMSSSGLDAATPRRRPLPAS